MPLVKCPRSGKLFDNSTGPVHPDVLQEEEADYSKISDYLAENPGSTTNEVAEATGVDPACVKRMVEQGRLEELDEATQTARLEEMREEERRRAKREAKRRSELLGNLSKVTTQKKKPVEFGGTVHNALSQKRRK